MTKWRDEMAAALPGARERSKIEAQSRKMLARCIEALEMIEAAGWRWTGSESGPLSDTALGAAVEAALEYAGMHAAEGRFAFDTDEREAALSLPSVEIRREALEAIAAERRRQIDVEGWTPEHDDAHAAPNIMAPSELAEAAVCYTLGRNIMLHRHGYHGEDGIPLWPWSREHWKPKDHRSNLIRAGALIVAEIERLDRALSPSKEEGRL